MITYRTGNDLDLDVVITGDLGELVDVKESFCIIDDWHLTCFNSSVMVLDADTHPEVWEDFRTHKATAGGDQQWITDKLPYSRTFPKEWCVSYRSHAILGPPKDCKVVCFHGEPKPDSIPSRWVSEYWHE